MTLYRVMIKLRGRKRFRRQLEVFDRVKAEEIAEHFRNMGIQVEIRTVKCEEA